MASVSIPTPEKGVAMKSILTVLLLSAMAACSTAPVQSTTPVAATSAATGVATGFTTDINAFRASQGLGAVQPNAALTRAAQAHADDMANRGYFSHESPNGPNGRTFVERAKAGGCSLRSGAENIATGQTSAAIVLTSWQKSAGHRRNMLVPSYTQYGLGRSGNIWVLKLAASC